MLVVHIDSRPDTARFPIMWEGLDCKVLYNPRSKSLVEDEIKKEKDLVILCGHGSPRGLFNKEWNGFIIDERSVQFLRNKKVIGSWCYASEFADKYDLKGFFTSMFISNRDEAIDYGFPDATEKDIELWDRQFAKEINYFLKNNIPMDEWVERIQNKFPMTGVQGYNYEALSYFD